MLETFKFWCFKVLPLVYDDSLSYYEVLCKVVDYINKLIEQDKVFGGEIEKLKQEISVVQNWIKNFDTSYAEEIIKQYIATMIFVEISDSGYIVYYIPSSWKDIVFNTTQLDIEINGYDYGRLVLSY
jgi:hypothetical protein|nr:MAG TPA: MAD PROTEIN/MAX PROTEIN/DNA factor, DNA, bHLHZ, TRANSCRIPTION-DNA.0A [Caudoviricetes sp.]